MTKAVRFPRRLGLILVGPIVVLAGLGYVGFYRMSYGTWSPLAAPDRIDYHNGRYYLRPEADAIQMMSQDGVSGPGDLVQISLPIVTEVYAPRLDSYQPIRLYSHTVDGKWHYMGVVGCPW